MRELAALIALVCLAHARADTNYTNLPRALLSKLGIKNQTPVHRLLSCGTTLGPTKCLSALSVFRAEHALEALESGSAVRFNMVEDVRRFPWEQYGNRSDEQLYSQLYDDTERLLRYRSLSLSLPGYSLELESKGNGTIKVDVLKSDSSGRSSMKKLQKEFYNIVPLLLLPGLIMSAILPFVLPALKLMTVGVGMLNNMALSGAVFTLLRNNAFNDKYEHKIIYVNEGYRNEKISPVYVNDDAQVEHVDVPGQFSASNVKGILATNDGLVEIPTDADFINQYYGNEGFKLVRRSQRIEAKPNRRKSRI